MSCAAAASLKTAVDQCLADAADRGGRGGRVVQVVSDHPMFLIPPPSKLSSSSTLCCR
ncbi:hypothetical protein OIU76_002896 [Salix suchowensis]|nr:hypothetical protein OIU76_002896 [Salix suchowensis]